MSASCPASFSSTSMLRVADCRDGGTSPVRSGPQPETENILEASGSGGPSRGKRIEREEQGRKPGRHAEESLRPLEGEPGQGNDTGGGPQTPPRRRAGVGRRRPGRLGEE